MGKKSKFLINEMYLIFNSINDKLVEHGILINKIEDGSSSFKLNFDLSKIDDNSEVKKHNIDGILFYFKTKKYFELKINLFKNNKRFYVRNRIFDDLIFLKFHFPITTFLRKICEVTNIKILNTENDDVKHYNYYFKDDIYNNNDDDYIIGVKNILDKLKNSEQYDIYKTDIKLLISNRKILKNNNMNAIELINLFNKVKKLNKENDNNKFLIKKYKKIKKNFNLTKNLNDKLNFKFIEMTMLAEKILFPEVFNFESEKPITDKNFNNYKKRYLQISANTYRIYEHNYWMYRKIKPIIDNYYK